MNTPKRHPWLAIVSGVALITGVSLATGVAGFALPWGASSNQAPALHAVASSQKPVALNLKDAKISGLGNHKEIPLSMSASRGTTPKARDPKTLPGKRADIDPVKELKRLSVALGGCLREYGRAGQCLPVVPPSQAAHVKEMIDAGLDPNSMPHNWTCSELRQYFPHGIEIRMKNVDPQRLDLDRNGIGCSPND